MKRTIPSPLEWKFDKDFREYLAASIRWSELQEPYQALDGEAEIIWIKRWLNKYANASKEVVLLWDNALQTGEIKLSSLQKKEGEMN